LDNLESVLISENLPFGVDYLRNKDYSVKEYCEHRTKWHAMDLLESRVADFSQSVRHILDQFQRLNSAASRGPHLELSQQEVRLTEHLRLVGSQKMKSISEYLGVAVNSVTSIVDNLERKGFVIRQRSSDDRRVVFVELTDAGRVVADASNLAKQQLLRSLLEVLSEPEQDSLVKLFKKIAASRVKDATQTDFLPDENDDLPLVVSQR
jgi:DNA-binding MarR family transcriptional regulator